MSVLKKNQFADAPMTRSADGAIIGAGTAECQKSIRAPVETGHAPCSTVVR
jgi:hypothetical protein